MVGRITYADELSIQMDWSVFSTFLKDLEELHSYAMGADLWPKISQEVLVACDPLFKQRFLRKRSHYEMEQEYRPLYFYQKMMKRTCGILFVASMYNMAVLGSMCRFKT